MADRYVDKQIKVLELIRKEKFRGDAISGHALKITDDELEKILEEFQQSNLLKVQQKDLLNSSDEYRVYDDILIYYLITDKDGLINLLAKLKKNHPRHIKPIIREKTLGKMAKQFGNLETKSEIVALLKKSGVPKLLIESQHMQWKMIFAVLNYYALSAKKEDFQIFKKIIEEFVHPLMFDGNKKEAQGMINMLNSLLEYDGFVIRDGHLQRTQKANNEIETLQNKPIFNKITIKSIRIDKTDHMLIINGGEKILPLRFGTKQFRILTHLWEFRWEMKNNKVLKDGDFESVENLRKHCSCPTVGAIDQHRKRINCLFKKNGIKMEIDNKNKKYRLVIDKS
jgi:hypothetical protein